MQLYLKNEKQFNPVPKPVLRIRDELSEHGLQRFPLKDISSVLVACMNHRAGCIAFLW